MFTIEFKKKVVELALRSSNREAPRQYDVDEWRVREWRTKIDALADVAQKQGGTKRKRLEVGGRKLTDNDLEADFLEWIHERRANMLRVSRKLIMRKAKAIHDEASDGDLSMQGSFVASRGWLDKFIKQNGLSLRRRTTVAQKNPSLLVDKLVMYAVQIRRLQQKFNYSAGSIIAMDETAVWSDMVAETTVDKTGRKYIPLKSTGHEKVKVSVCLTAKADGTRLKPFIVFGGAMRECKSLNE